MASYAVMLALADLWYSAPAQSPRFAPRVHEHDFACFFSVDSGWGVVRQTLRLGVRRADVEVHRGELPVRALQLGFNAGGALVRHGAREIDATVDREEMGWVVRPAIPVVIVAGETLSVTAGKDPSSGPIIRSTTSILS